MPDDFYDDLKEALPDELLEAVIMEQKLAEPMITSREEYLMRMGFEVVMVGGWMHCAPMWLRRYRESRE